MDHQGGNPVDAAMTWQERADDSRSALDADVDDAARRLEMVGRGPGSPEKAARPRAAAGSANRRPRKTGGERPDGRVPLTKDGATAEVPPRMEDDVGGKGPFDSDESDDEGKEIFVDDDDAQAPAAAPALAPAPAAAPALAPASVVAPNWKAPPDWPGVGTCVRLVSDPTVQGMVKVIGRSYKAPIDVLTTNGDILSLRKVQLVPQTLSTAGLEFCSRPWTQIEYLQMQIDSSIEIEHAGRTFRNCFSTANGTTRRQFDVTTSGMIRCCLCDNVDGDEWQWEASGAMSQPLSKQSKIFLALRKHAGRFPSQISPATIQHLERLREAAGVSAPAPSSSDDEAPAQPLVRLAGVSTSTPVWKSNFGRPTTTSVVDFYTGRRPVRRLDPRPRSAQEFSRLQY